MTPREHRPEYLILGGTGTLGKQITRELIKRDNYSGIRIYSRDEFKQWEMRKEFNHEYISFLIGDIRDQERLEMAMNKVTYVINCAAMKQVPACEENPIEAVKTNIDGSKNIIEAAIKKNVLKVMHVSTDKAVSPINLYGMTKGVAEKLFLHSNTYSPRGTKFSCCRYGNVLGSRGSIIPLFKEQKQKGFITITSNEMTRFWIRIETVANFILNRLESMEGKEIFIPKMKSYAVSKIANLIGKGCEIRDIGIREGEKLHEVLINNYESQHSSLIHAVDCDYYLINNSIVNDKDAEWEYCSGTYDDYTDKEFYEMVEDLL